MPRKSDSAIWSDERILRELKAAAKEGKKALEGYYSGNLANIDILVKERNQWMKRCARLKSKLKRQTEVLNLTIDDVARRTGYIRDARRQGWNDAVEAVAKAFEGVKWDMVTGEAGADQIRKLKR